MKHVTLLTAVIFALGALSSLPSSSQAASAAEIDREAKAALNTLYASKRQRGSWAKRQRPFSFFLAL